MQYIARAELDYAGVDGVMRHVSPGDALPEFATWPYILRLAHLEEGTVEEVGAQYTANLDTSGGYLSYPTRDLIAMELVDHVSEPATDATLEPVEEILVTEGVPASEDVVAPGTYPCTVCEKVYYRPSRLAKHMEKHI